MSKAKLAVIALAATLLPFIHPRQAAADVKLASLFTDHMVWQRDMKVPVWGTAEPGEDVTVSFAKQKVSGKAGPDGKWLLRLEPIKSGDTPLEMTVTGKNS